MRKKGFVLPRNDRKKLENELLRKLRQLLSTGELLRGNLSTRQKVCGTRTCHCARGEKHEATYLVQSRDGKLRQLFVPADLSEIAKQWVCNYQIMQELLEQLSDLRWQEIEGREL